MRSRDEEDGLPFPEPETYFRFPAGCRKVRRGDESRAACDDGSPSPASGRRQPTGRFAPRGGTVSAARVSKRSTAMAAPAERAKARAKRPQRASRNAVRGFLSVDTRTPSDTVDTSKKVEISRGFAVSYPSRQAPWGTSCIRFERSVPAARSG